MDNLIWLGMKKKIENSEGIKQKLQKNKPKTTGKVRLYKEIKR